MVCFFLFHGFLLSNDFYMASRNLIQSYARINLLRMYARISLVMVWTLTGFSGSVSFLEGLGLVGNGVKYI